MRYATVYVREIERQEYARDLCRRLQAQTGFRHIHAQGSLFRCEPEAFQPEPVLARILGRR